MFSLIKRAFGKFPPPSVRKPEEKVKDLQEKVSSLNRLVVRARYDAAQTTIANEEHWANADHFDPHSVASISVRRRLRARSRYEVIENNPFLKGTILTLANDFVGSGPKLQITDKRISKDRRQQIEDRWNRWAKETMLRQKLWRMRVAKIVDGESFMRSYSRKHLTTPVMLDFQVLEADRISSFEAASLRQRDAVNEVDGVRFDNFENPIEYHVLHHHPHSSILFSRFSELTGGDWIPARFIIHWFRQDRGWLRGIPEIAPSLPMTAVLRRYTLAMVRNAEVFADFTAIIESEGPANQTFWTDGQGALIDDDPFDTFPIEQGMITNLPWGYKMKQLQGVPLGAQYDEFVGSVLREIIRPLNVPFNIAAGTSKDSNMASAIVDNNIYRGGQVSERVSCQESVLDSALSLWWTEAVLIPSLLGDDSLAGDPTFRETPPDHVWRWDKVGLDHTDPLKVAKALQVLHNKRFLTDRDIQEIHHNRDLEDWKEEIAEDDKFRREHPDFEGQSSLDIEAEANSDFS